MQVVCARIELKPESLPAVRAWARELSSRSSEVEQTLLAEGVSVESAFLDRIGDTDYLVYYMRARDLEHAYAVGRQLNLPIQHYHNQFKRETWQQVKQLECLLDFECSAAALAAGPDGDGRGAGSAPALEHDATDRR